MRRTMVELVAALTLAVGGVNAGAHHDPHAVPAVEHAAASTVPAAADITVRTWRPVQHGGGVNQHGVRT